MNQVMITLAIMYVMDLMLFFLDTFLWYVIWSMVFNIAHLFTLGLSIWTPWNKIYSKLLATSDMEIKYKPKVILHYYSSFLVTHWALLYLFVFQVWNVFIISMYQKHLLST